MISKRNKAILALVRAGIETNKQIGERFGISDSRVEQIYRQYGVRRPEVFSKNGRANVTEASRSPFKAVVPPNKKQLRAAKLYEADNGSMSEIGKRLGLSRSAVAGAIFRERRRQRREERKQEALAKGMSR